MGCSVCKNGGIRVQHASIQAAPQLNAYGLLPLRGFEDCATPYTGNHKAASVYVVGYGTEHERLFRRTDRNAALEYQSTASPDGKLNLFQAPVTQLCADAALAVFGS